MLKTRRCLAGQCYTLVPASKEQDDGVELTCAVVDIADERSSMPMMREAATAWDLQGPRKAKHGGPAVQRPTQKVSMLHPPSTPSCLPLNFGIVSELEVDIICCILE